jgi:uncharacterized protein YndB with AHSA1/START domain
MTETTQAVFKIHIKGSIEDAWREITKTDEVQGCMFGMQLRTNGLKPGGQIRMRTADGKYTGVVGEVLEFDPPKRYSHTFRFTNYDDPPCKVTYELEKAGDGVDFRLIVDDLPPGTKTAKQMTKGGDFIAKNLKAIVETGKLPAGTRMLYRLFKLLAPFSPKKTLSTNWPLPGE